MKRFDKYRVFVIVLGCSSSAAMYYKHTHFGLALFFAMLAASWFMFDLHK